MNVSMELGLDNFWLLIYEMTILLRNLERHCANRQGIGMYEDTKNSILFNIIDLLPDIMTIFGHDIWISNLIWPT